ncbi:MAG: DUF805 domain-containing protein [Parvibaculaceae bacterium]
MDFSMFTGFEGRINRAKWWIGIIILAVVAVIISLILNAVLGTSTVDPTQPDWVTTMVRKISIGQLITLAIVIYPGLALAIKRLNDRDRPQWFAYVFYAPTVLTILAGLAGLTMTVNGGIPANSTIGWILSILSIVVGIWALIELGILKGTEGPNQHGPDPLAGK